LEDRFSDVINVLDHGFVDDGTTDNSAAANTLFQSSTVDKKKVIFPRSRNGTGVYVLGSVVTVTKDIYPETAPGVKLYRGNTATSYTLAFTTPQTMGFNLVIDGNKANNSLSANRAPMVKYWAAHHGVKLDGYFTNYVVGIYDTDSRYGWTANLGFYNGAEHEGTYSADLWHLSCPVNISHVNLTNSAAHFEFERADAINDEGPSTTGKGTGGFIWGTSGKAFPAAATRTTSQAFTHMRQANMTTSRILRFDQIASARSIFKTRATRRSTTSMLRVWILELPNPKALARLLWV
jgi:hypothetical protein